MENHQVQKWRIRDIIDLEYFLHRDAVSQAAEDQQYLNERDRNIFLESVRPCLQEGEKPARRLVIRAWLDRRRKEDTGADTVLPGEVFESLYGSFRMLSVISGLVLGGGAGLSFLGYTGARPLNVFVYLSVFVFSQVLLLLLFLFLFLYRLKRKAFFSSSPLYRFIGRSLLRIVLWARNRIAGKLKAGRRLEAEALQGLIMSRGRAYGLLFILPVFILTQLFGVGFNLGLLAMTVFRVITADIAFGWQSTLQLSPAAVHTLVEKIALPWSWLVAGDVAYPSLARIEGSRIILKEGIYHLSTPDLVSWWPFLCFSVLFYGLLPRLLIFLGALAVQGRRLATISFRQEACELLLLRMTTPLVSTRGIRGDAAAGTVEAETDQAGWDQAAAAARDRAILVMVPDDILDTSSEEQIVSFLRSSQGFPIARVLRISENYGTDAEMLAGLQDSIPAETDILLIQEAWQPPIAEYISFIRNLRRAVGPTPCIRIGLIGKPRPETIFTPVKDENRRIWTRKIRAIGDPCIYIKELVHNAG